MAQLSTLQNHLQDCAGLADKYNQLLQQLPAGSFPGANLPPIQFAPLVPAGGAAAGAATPRKRKSKAGDDGPEPEDGRRRRKKKVREEGQPKRPPSAYLFFQNEVRSQLKAAHPFTPHHELLGMISKQWSTMTPEQKKVRVMCVLPPAAQAHRCAAVRGSPEGREGDIRDRDRRVQPRDGQAGAGTSAYIPLLVPPSDPARRSRSPRRC
jgi:hypothetical protein